MTTQAPARDYARIASALGQASGPREARLQAIVDALWDELAPRGVSWVGFYTKVHDPQRGDEMILGPRRDKPACSPIGMHGACGRCWTARRPMVVRDVASLGAGYIACDPRDRSEVVLPMFEQDGSCWGVLDIDSHETGAFSASDVAGLQRICELAAVTTPHDWTGRIDTF